MCRHIRHRTPVQKQTPASTSQQANPPSTHTEGQKQPPKETHEVKAQRSYPKIDNLPRKSLFKIFQEHDVTILDDPRRIRAFLKDLCKGQHSREINAIITLLDEKIPQDMITLKNRIPYPVLSENLNQKIKENTYLSESLIQWAIDSWAIALGIIDPGFPCITDG